MFQNIDPSLKNAIIRRQDVVVYATRNYKIYLLGTNHTSKQSAKAAQKLVGLVQPKIVAVELCLERLENANVFKDREKYERKYRDLIRVPRAMRQKAVGEITRLILACRAMRQKNIWTEKSARSKRLYKLRPIRIDENLTIAGDVFSPFENSIWSSHTDNGLSYLSCPQVPYKIVLADRPMGVTCAKLASVLDQEEKALVRIYKRDFLGMFFENRGGIMKKIWSSNKSIRKIMVQERDEYLAESILRAAEISKIWGTEFSRVVAIVGRAHTDGILAQWISKSNERLL